jgi:hypothetical protein
MCPAISNVEFSQFLELARVLVGFHHVTGVIVNDESARYERL